VSLLNERTGPYVRTMNGEPRVIPLALIPDGRALFGELSTVRRLDANLVFLYRGRPMKRVHHAFYAACRRAGVAGLHIHDLRRCAATNLRRAGVDMVTATKIVGHKSDRMHRRYNTIEPDDLHKAAAKLHLYKTNTLITPAVVAAGTEYLTSGKLNESGRSSVVES